MENLKAYKDKHKGQDIYIIGSGASMDYVHPSFFTNKITIALNKVYKKYTNSDYCYYKDINTQTYFEIFKKEIGTYKIKFIAQYHDPAADYIYIPAANQKSFSDISLLGTDRIINTENCSTTAIHVAYYMGAANIILCGLDHGKINGRNNYKGYYSDDDLKSINAIGKVSGEWVELSYIHQYLEYDIQQLRNALHERGCEVMSLCPFINLGMEGHAYTRPETPPEHLWNGEHRTVHWADVKK